jgi:hypothetical protein
MSLRKNRPNCSPSHFLPKFILKIEKKKKVAQNSYFNNFQQTAQRKQ